MKISRVTFVAAVFMALFFLPVSTSAGRRLNQRPGGADRGGGQTSNSKDLYKAMAKRMGADPLQIAGSSLPDCSHACGSCSPCRLVMVSFVCASLEEAETCPMAYKCMCRNKSYPVP